MYIKTIEKTASVETVAAQQKQKYMDEKFLRLQKKYDKLDTENPHLKIEIRCYMNIIWLITQSPDNITENLPSKSILWEIVKEEKRKIKVKWWKR